MAAAGAIEKVSATLRRVLQIDPVTELNADTRLLGGIPEFDSLAVASVLLALEEEFEVEFHDEDITAELFTTVATLSDFVAAQAGLAKPGARRRAQFIEAPSGRLFLLECQPAVASRRCVLLIPPFAEEMNRARALMATAAIALAERGVAACYFDLHGTGDSDGDFADARWGTWLADLDAVIRYLRDAGYEKFDLVGVRLGALLALHCARRLGVGQIVLWDAVLDASSYIDRFLRTRAMAEMMSGETGSVAALRRRLSCGEAVEVGGYLLHPDLVAELDVLEATDELTQMPVHWISCNGKSAAAARAAGVRPDCVHITEYEPFWASAEITEAPELIKLTLDCLAATDA